MKKGFIRNSIPYIVVFGLLGGFAGVVWITHYPETPWLDKAEKWPLVGGPLADLRSAYLPDSDPRKRGSEQEEEGVQVAEAGSREPRPSAEPEEPLTLFIGGDKPAVAPSSPKVPSPNTPASGIRAKADASGSSSPEVEPIWATSVSPPGRVDGKGRTGDLHKVEIAKRDSGSSASSASSDRSDLGHSGRGLSSTQQQVPWLAEEWEWILPGNRVLDAAHSEAELLTELTAMAYLPVLMRKGAWAEVIFAGERGWVDTAWKPPFSRKKSRRGILRERAEPTVSSDIDDLRRARKILGSRRPSRRLGAYDVYTDVQDEELLTFLDSAAAKAEDAYFARYGRLPSGNPQRTVVLFAREADYRTYSGSSFPGGGTNAGHARSGVLAFFAENRPREELARTLVHEITHLVNDRALARRLPIWLEEGMASDLGGLWIEPSVGVVTEGMAQKSRKDAWRSIGSRPDVRMLRLGKALETGQLAPIGVLWSLDHAQFHSPALESDAYAQSAALVRYLMNGDGGRFSEDFRFYLRGIAIGHGTSPKLLVKRLDVDFDTFERGFRVWVARQAKISSARIERRARAVRSR